MERAEPRVQRRGGLGEATGSGAMGTCPCGMCVVKPVNREKYWDYNEEVKLYTGVTPVPIISKYPRSVDVDVYGNVAICCSWYIIEQIVL